MSFAVRMEKIVKGFRGVEVLHGVDFELFPGEVLALMGENGAGKSTLMKVLVGVYPDWSGTVEVSGKRYRFRNTREAERAGIAIIYQELNLVQGLSVAENIFLGREPLRWGICVDYPSMKKSAREILKELPFDGDVTWPVSRLRVGNQQLVEIGKALSMNARILIMDEPTSALSEKETQDLFSVVEKLKKTGVSIVFITHRMSEVFQIADRITVLRDGIHIGTRKAVDVDRKELIRMMVGRDIKQFFIREGLPGRESRLKVDHLTRYHSESGKKALVQDISFDVFRGEILGIAGLLGSGRTELLESLFGGDASHTTGSIRIDGMPVTFHSPVDAISAGMGLITEDRKKNGLVMSMSVLQNITLSCLVSMRIFFMISDKKEKHLTESYLKRLSVSVHSVRSFVAFLSGGNQQKVLMAKWLATHPKVLLLDEPTRGVDVASKYDIYVLLSQLTREGMSIIMTSSELPELLSICDRILVLREGRMSALINRDEATQEKIMDAATPF